jgi:hypothetical protein
MKGKSAHPPVSAYTEVDRPFLEKLTAQGCGALTTHLETLEEPV